MLLDGSSSKPWAASSAGAAIGAWRDSVQCQSHPYGWVEVLPRGHPVYQQKGKMSLEEAKLPTGILASCNKYLRCKKLTKWNGVRHESEICLFKLENSVISAMLQCLGAV